MDCYRIFQLVFWSSILRSTMLYSLEVNVTDYGAVGDGLTDDSQAFSKAWIATCGANSSVAVLNVPKGKKFLLNTSKFEGPCKSPKLNFVVGGEIVAPGNKSDWKGHDVWLTFRNVNGLIIYGNGLFDGRGAAWWESAPDGSPRPAALRFSACDNLQLSGLTLINSPRSHISIGSSTNATITNLQIIAPETSHNTDGIDISSLSNVQIADSYIGTGDDCIAINGGCKNVTITRVACGPGHGISIGSLGRNGSYEAVEEIYVRNCSFNATQNGARIKTWQGGSGFARKIVFENITLINAYNPIIIDQYYFCTHGKTCENQKSAVALSNISFTGFRGTSMSDEAINLSCSRSVGCTDILIDHVNITTAVKGQKVRSSCINAYGRYYDSIPRVDCLLP